MRHVAGDSGTAEVVPKAAPLAIFSDHFRRWFSGFLKPVKKRYVIAAKLSKPTTPKSGKRVRS